MKHVPTKVMSRCGASRARVARVCVLVCLGFRVNPITLELWNLGQFRLTCLQFKAEGVGAECKTPLTLNPKP